MRITLDFETQSEAELKKVGAFEYSMHPTTIATCLGFKLNNSPKIFLFDYYQMQKPFLDFPSQFRAAWRIWIQDPNVVFCAHNAFFEMVLMRNVLTRRLGWPPIPQNKWRCTAAKAAACAIPRNLDGAGRVMALTTQKSFEGHHAMLKTCKPTSAWKAWNDKRKKLLVKDFDEAEIELRIGLEPLKFHTPETAPETFEVLYKYCKIDVITEEKLDESLPDLTPFEQRLWFLDQKINFRGVQVDIPLVKKISGIMAAESKSMSKELDTLTMGLVSSGNARNQILEFLQLEGLELPDLKAKTVDDFLANGKMNGDAKKLLELRRALSKASTAKYQKFLLCAATDGRVRDLFMYHAASTGRWGGKNVQPQNFPRGIIKDIDLAIEYINTLSVDDLKFIYGENLMPLFSSVLRGMFTASKGCELFVEDFSAIETRVAFWLAGHEKGLDIFRRNGDPYKEQAVEIFRLVKGRENITILDVTDEERQVGKAAVLGCGFQMGWRKFKAAAWDVYRAYVDDDTAKLAVSAYRKLHYPVTELWSNYQDAAIFAVEEPDKVFAVGRVSFFMENSFLCVKLPSGRCLRYKDPSVRWGEVFIEGEGPIVGEYPNRTIWVEGREVPRPYREDDKIFQAKKLKYFAVNNKAKKSDSPIPKWTEETTYGGKLTENIVQAVARDLLAEAIMRAEKNGFSVLMHSHDELVAEAPIGEKTSEEYKKIMGENPKWADGLPLKTGGWVGPRYHK